MRIGLPPDGVTTFANPRFSVPGGTGELRGVTPESRCGELVLDLADPVLTTDVARAVCDWAFRTMGLHRVEVWVGAGDEAPYEAAGFVREVVARDRLHVDGVWRDAVMLAVLA